MATRVNIKTTARKKTKEGRATYAQRVAFLKKQMALTKARKGPQMLIAKQRRSTDEIKCVDLDTVQYGFTTSGTFALQNGIATGTEFYNRIGRKVTLKYLWVQGFIQPSGATSTATNGEQARIAVIYDKQPNAAAPVLSDIFQDVDKTGGTTTDPLSGTNLNNRERFIILRDEVWAMPLTTAQEQPALTSNKNNTAAIDWFVPLKDAIAIYNGSGNGINSIDTGALYVVSYGSQTTSAWVANLSARLRFDDK